MSDEPSHLLERIAQGDQDAFADFYRLFELPVYRFVLSKLNRPADASDVVHDVFMEVWRSAGRFEGRSKVRTWVFGIAYRKAIDVLRKAGRVAGSDELPEQVDEGADAEACIAAAQEADHVRYCLDQLKADQREAVALAFYEDMPYAEIAEIAGVPEGTIKSRVYHAKQALLRCLSGRLGKGAP